MKNLSSVSTGAAKGLVKLGIRKGNRVTICMPNTPQALDCFYALNRIGAIPNMIHPLSAAQEIAFYLNVSHSKAVLTLDQFYGKVAEILPHLDDDCKVIIARIADELPFPLSVLYPMTQGCPAGSQAAQEGLYPLDGFDRLRQGRDPAQGHRQGQ